MTLARCDHGLLLSVCSACGLADPADRTEFERRTDRRREADMARLADINARDNHHATVRQAVAEELSGRADRAQEERAARARAARAANDQRAAQNKAEGRYRRRSTSRG